MKNRLPESYSYIVVLVALAVWQLAVSFGFRPEPAFGFDQLRHLGLPGTAAALLVLAALLFYTPLLRRVGDATRRLQAWLYSHWLYSAGAGALASIVFFGLRSGFRNTDSQALTWKFHVDVLARGSHVTHDEMWELYLHSRFWYYTHEWWGWPVDLSYQVLSCAAGGAFVFAALLYCRQLLPERALPLFFVLVSGGSMQLFFGDVENYTLTGFWILAYLFASAAYLKGRLPILWPSALLAVALTFHLLAGFLGPSLLYLHSQEIRRGRAAESAKAAVLATAVVVLTLVFFHYNNLPIRNLYFHSHAFGHGGNILGGLATPSVSHYLMQLNLLALMFPAWVLLPPMLLFGRIRWDPINIHLGLATGFMLLFQGAWDPKLGVFNDWNLFANVAFPLAMFIGYNLLSEPELRHRWRIATAAVALSVLHSYSWIVANHFR